MNYKGLFFRTLSLLGCIGFFFLFLSIFEAAYFLGDSFFSKTALAGLVTAFLLGLVHFFIKWSAKKYLIAVVILTPLLIFGYLLLWPGYWKKELNPIYDTAAEICPMTLDRYFYRTIILKNDPLKGSKVERLEDFCRAMKLTFDFSNTDDIRGSQCPHEPEKRVECFIELVHSWSSHQPIGTLSQMAVASTSMRLSLAVQRQTGSTMQAILSFGRLSLVQAEILKAWLDRSEKDH